MQSSGEGGIYVRIVRHARSRDAINLSACELAVKRETFNAILCSLPISLS
jgi:hypothetical protein